MDELLNILNSLNGISINLNMEEETINIHSLQTNDSICKIELSAKRYTAYKSDNFEDIFRTLEWLGFKNDEKSDIKVEKCNGLGCENCSGCAFSTLSSFYKAKLRINEYVSSHITEKYTFIGALSLEELHLKPSTFRTYITYVENIFGFIEMNNEIADITTYRNNYSILDNIETKLYIEQIIPEALRLNNFEYLLYGIYNNRAVVWKYVNNCGRYKWFYEEL